MACCGRSDSTSSPQSVRSHIFRYLECTSTNSRHYKNKENSGRERQKTSKQTGVDLQVAVIVEGLADLLGNGLVHLHNGGLITAAVAVVRRAEDRAHSLPHRNKKARHAAGRGGEWGIGGGSFASAKEKKTHCGLFLQSCATRCSFFL